jgi:hypothetical protein
MPTAIQGSKVVSRPRTFSFREKLAIFALTKHNTDHSQSPSVNIPQLSNGQNETNKTLFTIFNCSKLQLTVGTITISNPFYVFVHFTAAS